jgi:hypothetical protein
VSAVESFPLGDLALIRIPASGGVAVVDRRVHEIIEALSAGQSAADLAMRHAGAAGGLDEAARQVLAIREAWLGLTRPAASPAPIPLPAAATDPVLDIICDAGELPVGLRIWPTSLARVLAAVTEPCGRPADRGDATAEIAVRWERGRYWLSVDGSVCLRTRDPMLARSEVLRRLVLASHPDRDWLAILHAAGVAGPDGAALLCGSSGAGKSTLTGMLVASGLAPVTDDYAPIEAGTRALWPVPFGLSAKEGSWPLLAPHFPALATAHVIRTRQRRQRYVAPPRWAAGPVPVRCLLFPLYAAGEPLSLIRLEPGEALAILARTGGWYENSSDRLAELTGWLGTLPAYALSYGDGLAAVDAVRRLLAADA